MQQSLTHIFRKIAVLFLTAFVCLPCSLKREIKQTLNIPIAENTVKYNQSILCANYISGTHKNVSVSVKKKKETLNRNDHYFDNFQKAIVAYSLQASFAEKEISFSVPIFILNEQYLI